MNIVSQKIGSAGSGKGRVSRVAVMALAVPFALVGSVLVPQAAHASSIPVACTSASLVNAIVGANLTGADTLELSTGCPYVLTAPDNTTDAPNGLPQVTAPIIVHGNGASITRKAAVAPFRIFDVGSTGKLTLDNLTISGGALNTNSRGGAGLHCREGCELRLTNSRIINNATATTMFDAKGGAIWNEGSLWVSDSVISGNSTGSFSFGGAIYNDGNGLALAEATVTNTQITNNVVGTTTITNTIWDINHSLPIPPGSSGSSGAAGIANYAKMTVDNSKILGNTIYENAGSGGNGAIEGGGISDYSTRSGSFFTLTNSVVSGNTIMLRGDSGRVIGGGILAWGLTMTVSDTVISNNSISLVINPGARWWVTPQLSGAGILNQPGSTLVLNNTKVLSNTASSPSTGGSPFTVTGGGIGNFGSLSLTGSTVASNSVSAPFGSASGGGIYNANTATMTSSSVVANVPDNCGGSPLSGC